MGGEHYGCKVKTLWRVCDELWTCGRTCCISLTRCCCTTCSRSEPMARVRSFLKNWAAERREQEEEEDEDEGGVGISVGVGDEHSTRDATHLDGVLPACQGVRHWVEVLSLEPLAHHMAHHLLVEVLDFYQRVAQLLRLGVFGGC